ncbi:hypothetical protein [Galactobacter valiniphilus]|uniref:hypothetical protein n=1 Tax=Galactobacter valiniphilus TaxID=2676122 RepID=UPI003735DC6A
MSIASVRRPWLVRFLMNPWVRFAFASAIFVCLALTLLLEVNPDATKGWLPGWWQVAGKVTTLVLAIQPLAASVVAGVSKAGVLAMKRGAVELSLGELLEQLRQLSKLAVTGSWNRATAETYRAGVLRTGRTLLENAGIDDVRVSYYTQGKKDSAPNETTDEARDLLVFVQCSRSGSRREPTPTIERSGDIHGIFGLLEDSRPSPITDRRDYEPGKSSWQSALRVGVENPSSPEAPRGVVTADAPGANSFPEETWILLEAVATLLMLAQEEEAEQGPPVDTLQDFVGEPGASGHPQAVESENLEGGDDGTH